MNYLTNMILAIIISAGGIGGVIIAVIHFSSNIIADRLQKKYQLVLDRQLEYFKADVENKKYISKTKFDAEFSLYRSLSKKFFDMVKAISILIPYGIAFSPVDEQERRIKDKENYQTANNYCVIAQDELYENAAFIPEDFYEAYTEILSLCHRQLIEFRKRWDMSYVGTITEKELLSPETYKRTDEILTKFTEFNKEIRIYLDKLDVIE